MTNLTPSLALAENIRAKTAGVERIPIQNRAQWLALRQNDLTASDVAAICGVGRRTALAVYAEKLGLVPPQADNDVMRKGRWLEAAVFEALAEERPQWETRRAKVYLRDPAARLGATPDGVAIDERGRLIVIQAKVVSRPVFERDWREDPDDEYSTVRAPLGYQLQTLTEAMLAGAAWSCIAALVHDTYTADLHIVPVERHAGAETMIRERVAGFWADMDAGRQPTLDPERDADVVKALYPRDDGNEIDLSGDNEILELVDHLAVHKATIKEAESRKSTVETTIKAKLGEASSARLADGRRVTWRLQHRDGYEVAATSFRRLAISKGRT